MNNTTYGPRWDECQEHTRRNQHLMFRLAVPLSDRYEVKNYAEQMRGSRLIENPYFPGIPCMKCHSNYGKVGKPAVESTVFCSKKCWREWRR